MRKILIIFTIIIILGVLLLSFVNTNDKKIIDNLKTNNFIAIDKDNYYKKTLSKSTLEVYNNNVKSKKEDDYEQITFSLENYTAEKLHSHYKDEVETIYNSKYNFITNEITYKIKFTYTTLNVIIVGTYKDDKRNTCNIDFSYDAKKEVLEDELCNKAKEYNKKFISQINLIFTNNDKNIIKKAI